ncbi:ABC transporter ATP-binding protein [Pseudidiomarina sp. PP-1MA]|uniref:ABC transporter ATP-binding protein n=1 Tax=Pseudidiomarina sp. PP-1MA TaxID=3237706 RepID=A0AB39XA29_9GAMM
MAVIHLSIQGLNKSYGEHYALSDINLTASSGEVLAILGKNGAGKTSLINSVLGIHAYQADQLELFGHPMLNQHRPLAVRQRLGVMMQLGTLAANLTVYEQLDLFCSYYQNGFQVGELINKLNLSSIAKQRFGKLSGGQRQQVLFALAVAGKPDLLFLDEPTVGMDVEARHALWQHIQDYRSAGTAIVLTTHYIEEAERLADRVAMLREGRVIAAGTLSEVIADHGSLEQAYLANIQEQRYV